MVDPVLNEITLRLAMRVRGMMNWLIRHEAPNEGDALLFATLVRAAVLGAADEGEYRQLGVMDGVALSDLRVSVHLHTTDCQCGKKAGDMMLDFDWSKTPLLSLTTLPDPEDN